MSAVAVDWSAAIERLEEHLMEQDDATIRAALFGDVLRTEEWLAAVDMGAFVDYDGYAMPLIMNAERAWLELHPSRYLVTPYPPKKPRAIAVAVRTYNRRMLRANCKYVVWFNR